MEMKKKLNADKIYKHYGIARPTYRCQPKDVLKALLEIKKNNEISNKYCDPIIDFLQQKRISIEDIVYYDLISKIFPNSNEIKAILRKIFYLLCSKYKVLNLALELCIVPDLSNGYCDYNNPKSLEAGLGEAYLGIYPYSIITTNVRQKTIEPKLSIEIKLIKFIKEFLKNFRFHSRKTTEVEADTSTLINYAGAICRLLTDQDIKDWKEFEDEEGAKKIREFFLKERHKLKNGKEKKYHISSKNNDIFCIKFFFELTWQQMGLAQNPYDIDAKDSFLHQKIVGNLGLSQDSDCYERKREQGELKKRIPDNTTEKELYTSSCFDDASYKLLQNYIQNKYRETYIQEIKDLKSMNLTTLWKLHSIIQGDLVITFGLLNGPRPIDYLAINIEDIVEDISKFRPDINAPENKKYFTGLFQIENNVKLSKNKKRPKKEFFGILFVIFLNLWNIRKELLKKERKKIEQDKYSYMIRMGTPLFFSKKYQRPVGETLTKYFRKSIILAGMNPHIAQIATLYWLRKNFVIFMRKWYNIEIEVIAVITGTNPKTLYDYYNYLNLSADVEKNYVNNFLRRTGFLPHEYVMPVQNDDINKNSLFNSTLHLTSAQA